MLWSVQLAVAQTTDNDVVAQIESAKIGLITQRLALTPEQSKQFWPVYNQYSKEKKEIIDAIKGLRGRKATKTDEELRRDIEKLFELEEKKIALDRRYFKEFQKVITVRQIAELYKAEQFFKRKLLEELGKRRGGGGQDMLDD